MRIEQSNGDNGDDLVVRRERVVGSVMSRINAAPLPRAPNGMLFDLASFSIPAIAAAVLVIVASTAFTVTHDRATRDPSTIAEGLGVPPMLRERNQ